MTADRRPNSPYQARDELRGLLLVAAVAAVPDQQPVVVHDAGPGGAGAISDGAATAVTSRIRVEIGDPAGTPAPTRLAAARRYLADEGWAVVRSSHTELVAVRGGFTITVAKRDDERRLVLTGETPALPL
ncbi:hypothetical protein [Actinocatenispora rupis]|uniref:Uncharacterized protein n=1 Tax=Actinocatenispora rupis TaxID=519421 RepID=A0A8J3J7P7_9ACTN|nr:hypothetical protein [Actinocatenispora rupis]GID11667.1 hypothetical protein Aru02nite_25560 [Actinocatenispora rupis]